MITLRAEDHHMLLFIPCAIIALALIRWFPQTLAIVFCLLVLAVCFAAFYVLSFFNV
jgi:hypothetical protein